MEYNLKNIESLCCAPEINIVKSILLQQKERKKKPKG